MSLIKKQLIILLSLLFIVTPSYAGLIMIDFTSGTGYANDCSGYWNSMQDDEHSGCWIFTLDNEDVQYISPIQQAFGRLKLVLVFKFASFWKSWLASVTDPSKI